MSDDTGLVLVVDDDDHLARTVCDILDVHGFQSVAAGTGRAGLEIAAERADALPVALVDLRLPDMGGLEVVARLNDVAALTEVVILTGNASLDSAVAALRENSCDYLVKPVPPTRLVETVRRGVRRWHHRSAVEELRRDRERFQVLIEALSDVVLVVGPDGRIQYQSPSASRTLGVEPGALEGTRLLDHVNASERRAVAGGLAAAASAPGRERSFEFRFRMGGGAWALLEGVARTVHGGPDTPIVLTCRDITERRRLEEELRHSQRMESIGRLAGGVAHDFNNQLSAILSGVDLASMEAEVPAPVLDELSEIRMAAQRAARLTRQLLIFSRKDVTEERRVKVNEVVEGMGVMLRRLVPTTIEIRKDLGPDLPPVFIDPTQLEQVLLNLVVNARDAMEGQGGVVAVRTSLQPDRRPESPSGTSQEPDRFVTLEVEDDGTGMTDEVLSQIFEPFFTTKGQGRGTGLGLATCYGIATRAGGWIQVRSTLGQGTVFEVQLPGRPDLPEPEGGGEAEDEEPGGGVGKVVLLVEDDPAVRRGLARILETDGYEVRAVGTGVEAVEALPEGRLDLLLTDLVMPGLTGPQVAQKVKRLRPDATVLFMSGYADGEVLGSDPLPFGGELLRKPVEAKTLLRRVRELLRATDEA